MTEHITINGHPIEGVHISAFAVQRPKAEPRPTTPAEWSYSGSFTFDCGPGYARAFMRALSGYPVGRYWERRFAFLRGRAERRMRAA